jgi:hypothetical protein
LKHMQQKGLARLMQSGLLLQPQSIGSFLRYASFLWLWLCSDICDNYVGESGCVHSLYWYFAMVQWKRPRWQGQETALCAVNVSREMAGTSECSCVEFKTISFVSWFVTISFVS